MAKQSQRAAEMEPFLRAIAAHPDEDAPRLVFADWLDEHEQPERAEFIRLQIELARTDPSADGYAEKTARMRRCGVFTHKGPVRGFDYVPSTKCRIGFRRGFIEVLHTLGAERIDASAFDLVPLLALRTNYKHLPKFRAFSKLKWLEFSRHDTPPAQLLEVLGPNGWFKELETLSLMELNRACLEAGVIPKFDLPKLRNFYLYSDDFSNLGGPHAEDAEEDEYGGFPWNGLADWLPKNAIPNAKCPVERFVWHSGDDSDSYNDEDWHWRGPTMEALLEQLKGRKLKQIEMLVDHDDHENGAEGVRAAPYVRNSLDLSPALECLTLTDNASNLRMFDGSTQRRLKSLRVYGDYDIDGHLFTLLQQPVCSELDSLLLEVRGEWHISTPSGKPNLNFARLKWLYLAGSLNRFARWECPELITLLGSNSLDEVHGRHWSKLQTLEASFENPYELHAFAQSSCCPNLTTLTLSPRYFDADEVDFSFLAHCPHMPHLSLIHFSCIKNRGTYIVSDGQLLPVREDVILDDLAPTLPHNVRFAF